MTSRTMSTVSPALSGKRSPGAFLALHSRAFCSPGGKKQRTPPCLLRSVRRSSRVRVSLLTCCESPSIRPSRSTRFLLHAGFLSVRLFPGTSMSSACAPFSPRVCASFGYIPPEALRHSAPTPAQYPQIEKGRPLFLDHLESGWIFHCYTLREHGVVVAGPDPHTLIDPVDPDAMRRAAATIAGTWLEQAQHDADWLTWLRPRKHQAFVLLTLCRLLYTLDTGTLASKPAAARWVQKTLGRPWAGFIERSRAGLHTSEETLESDANEIVTFIHYTVERFRQWDTSSPNEGKSGG